jgi:integrase
MVRKKQGRGFKNKNGDGCVTKLSGNRRRPFIFKITVGFNEDSKQIVMPVSYHETRPEAVAAQLKYNEKPYNILTKKSTFEQVCGQWFISRRNKKKKLSESVMKDYERAFARLKKLHKKMIVHIKHIDLQEAIDECELGFTIKSHLRTFITSVFAYSLKFEIISEDVSKGLELDLEKPDSDGKVINEPHLKFLWSNPSPEDKLSLIMAYTGMRPGEFVAIKTENVFLEESYMIGGLKTDAGKGRIIPVHSAIRPFIDELYDTNSSYLLMSAKYKGKSMSKRALGEKLAISFKKFSNVHYVPKDCRHTCASLMHSSGVDDFRRKMILGHAQQGVTNQVYTHKEINELVEAINMIPIPSAHF